MRRFYMNRYLCCLLASVLCLAPTAAASGDPASVVAPFVDEQTLLVARLDLRKLMPSALADLIMILAGERAADSGAAVLATSIGTWTDAGGGAIYMVVTLADAWPLPLFFVAPLAAEHDLEAIEALWRKVRPHDLFRLEMIHGAAIAAAPATLARLRTQARIDLPELRPAFEAVSAAGLQIVVRGSNDTRRVIAELLPRLPEELGGGPSTLITEQLQWAAVAADLFPKITLKLRLQANSPQAAAALARGAEALLVAIAQHVGEEFPLGHWDQLQHALTPRVQGDALLIEVDRHQLARLINDLLPVLERARTATRRAESITQMRGLHTACLLYAQEKQNKGQFPPDLATLVARGYQSPESLLSPFSEQSLPPDFDDWPDDKQRRWLNANTSYVLLPRLTTGESDLQRIALIEKLQFSQDQQVLIAYHDGYAASRPYNDAQQAIIEQTGKTLEEWSGLPEPIEP